MSSTSSGLVKTSFFRFHANLCEWACSTLRHEEHCRTLDELEQLYEAVAEEEQVDCFFFCGVKPRKANALPPACPSRERTTGEPAAFVYWAVCVMGQQ
jgi:hypothetical protein